MTIFFSGSELLEMATGIEKNGMAFYQALAKKTRKADVKGIYNYLAEEEKKHLNTFQGMADSLGQGKAPEIGSEEYMLYLKALIDNVAFSNVTQAQEKAAKVLNEIEAIGIGIQAEKDSILFYTEFQNSLRERDRKVVLKILDEEKTTYNSFRNLQQNCRERKSWSLAGIREVFKNVVRGSCPPRLGRRVSLVLHDPKGSHYKIGRSRISGIAKTNLSPKLEQN